MQSGLPRFPHALLTWVTLCAIAAPTSSAWAEEARAHDPLSSLFGSPTGDEASVTSSEESEASAAVAAPIAYALPAGHGPLGSLSLPRLAPFATGAPGEQSSAQPPASDGADDGSDLRTAGYVAEGVGLVGLALFAIAGLEAKNAYDQLTPIAATLLVRTKRTAATSREDACCKPRPTSVLAAGLTGLGVGATLMVLGSHSLVEKTGAFRLRLDQWRNGHLRGSLLK